MSLPRLPSFDDNYDGSKMRQLVDTIENGLRRIAEYDKLLISAPNLLNSQYTTVGNTGSSETNLMQYTLPANTIKKNGYALEIIAWGLGANNANSKHIKLKFGSAVLFDSTTTAANFPWRIHSIISRTGTAAQITNSIGTYDNITIQDVAGTETLSSNITIKCTGTATSTNDITQKGLQVRLFPYE